VKTRCRPFTDGCGRSDACADTTRVQGRL